MTNKAKKGMSREQAAEIYKDLQTAMAKMLKNEADYYQSKGQPVPGTPGEKIKLNPASRYQAMPKNNSVTFKKQTGGKLSSGSLYALSAIFMFAFAKVIISALEFAGVASVTPVEASYMPAPVRSAEAPLSFTKEEMHVLTSLDGRRSELEERSQKLDEREQELAKKDREFAGRLTELRELTDRLKIERDKNEKKRSGQLDQLANVYGSMNPQEAAQLIEQLDVTIALSLIERMPEKRIGQILALMSPERALSITRMLSSRTK